MNNFMENDNKYNLEVEQVSYSVLNKKADYDEDDELEESFDDVATKD